MTQSRKALLRLATTAPIVLLIAASAKADVVTLKTGETVHCTFLSGTSRSIRVEVSGVVKTYDLGQIATISFLDGDLPATAPGASGAARSVSTPVPVSNRTIPSNTSIAVRVIDPIDSGSARPGQIFAAVVEEPVIVSGTELIARESPAQLRIVNDSVTSGQANLTLVLSSVTFGGRIVMVSTSNVKSSASAQPANQEAAKIGSSASALSGIASALGAGRSVSTAGSAASGVINTGSQLSTRGPKVKIPAGSRLTFQLQTPVSY